MPKGIESYVIESRVGFRAVSDMGIVAIEEKLDELFESAIGVDDTIWYTKTQTLRDAIMDMIESEMS